MPGSGAYTRSVFVLWLVLLVAFVAVEVHTQAFYAVFAALGATAAAVSDLAGADLWTQGALFVAVSVTGLVLLRPWVRARFDVDQPPARLHGIQASADGLVGQHAVTVDVVGDEHHPGHALFAGERWLAVTDLAQPLPAQVPVVIAAVRGTTLLVRPRAGTAD